VPNPVAVVIIPLPYHITILILYYYGGISTQTVLAFVTLKSTWGMYGNDKFAGSNNSYYAYK